MALSRAAWMGGLGWAIAAALGLALVFALTNEHQETELRQSSAVSRASIERNLAICQAQNRTLEATIEVLQPGASGEPLLTRRARGMDACSRALEAEQLIRESLK